jgi:class 3 adenylate cyclase
MMCVAVADLQEYRDLDISELRERLSTLFAECLARRLDGTCSTPELEHHPSGALGDNVTKFARHRSDSQDVHDELDKTRRDLELAKAQIGLISAGFQRFVHQPFLTREGATDVADVIDSLRPGRHRDEEDLTILFSDIRSFSTLSELMSARETFDFLNSYMSQMEPCITRNNGYIDKLIGDAIMAIFQSPDDAVAAACAMQDAVMDYNRNRLADGRNPISSGIGINTGPAMFGLLGTMAHLDSTVIGDAVNLSSRLEALTKLYGVRILVSEFTRERLTSAEHVRLIDRVRLHGRESAVGIYEVFGFGNPEVIADKVNTQSKFEKAFELYLGGRFQEAAVLFRECSRECTRDLPSRVHIARCEYLKDNPPPREWDGIFQKRAARFDIGDMPARLYFERSLHNKAFESVFIRNLSDSGVLLRTGLDTELYIGERVLVEFTLQTVTENGGKDENTLCMTCQVKRGTPGILENGNRWRDYGLEFHEMTRAQRQSLRKVLPE